MNTHGRRWWWPASETRRALLGVVVMLLMGYTLWQVSSVINCQKDFNVLYSQGLKERSDAAASERQAQRTMLDALLDPTATPVSRSAALQTWRVALDEADAKRDANPIPEDPQCD
jgi:hypothetical protein